MLHAADLDVTVTDVRASRGALTVALVDSATPSHDRLPRQLPHVKTDHRHSLFRWRMR
jgi:hypothetical protein